jgi:hypothetical protein
VVLQLLQEFSSHRVLVALLLQRQARREVRQLHAPKDGQSPCDRVGLQQLPVAG